MNLPRLVVLFSILIFSAIGVGAIIKKINKPSVPVEKGMQVSAARTR